MADVLVPCQRCGPARKHLENLLDSLVDVPIFVTLRSLAEGDVPYAFPNVAARLCVRCELCDSTGVLLTSDGEALLEIFQKRFTADIKNEFERCCKMIQERAKNNGKEKS